MMPKLQAEEGLMDAMSATHPHLEAKDQRQRIRLLQGMAGLTAPVAKATRADLTKMRIKVNDGS